MNGRTRFFSITLVAAMSCLACQSGDRAGAQDSEPAATKPGADAKTSEAATAKSGDETSAHASAKAKPGSHEDWCEEHQVPESLCTQCNPALVAAFNATGDWCEEHGLPESQCRICNPNLKIERPAKVEREG